jgi:hypothetical protein
MSDQINLDDCPEILKDAVTAELAICTEFFRKADIISCTALKQAEKAETTYKVYIFTANYFTVITYTDAPPDRYNLGVYKDSMTIGEIKEILRAAPKWFT